MEEPRYAAAMEVRRVVEGRIRWRRQRVFVGKGLNGERVGLEAIEEGVWRVWFSFYELGLFDEREWRLQPCPGPAAGHSSGCSSTIKFSLRQSTSLSRLYHCERIVKTVFGRTVTSNRLPLWREYSRSQP